MWTSPLAAWVRVRTAVCVAGLGKMLNDLLGWGEATPTLMPQGALLPCTRASARQLR